MIAAVIAMVVAQPALGPVVPAGASRSTLEVMENVYGAIATEDWTSAKSYAEMLPRTSFTMTVDYKEVPSEARAVFAEGVKLAVDSWEQVYPDLDIKMGTGNDLLVTFTESLPPREANLLPAGSALIASLEPGSPRFELVVANKRLQHLEMSSKQSVAREVAFGIGSFLGLAEAARPTAIMGHTDVQFRGVIGILADEVRMAKELVGVGTTLRQAIAQKRKLEMPKPVANLSVQEFSFEPVLQGEIIRFSIQINNTGNSVLKGTFAPDCGCFRVGVVPEVAPGSSVVVQGLIDTTSFPGPFNKAVYFYSNDSELPIKRIGFKTQVEPAYRAIFPGTEPAIVMPDNGGDIVGYFWSNPKAKISINQILSSGLNSTVKMEKWSGKMADPEMGEVEALQREGYKLTIKIPGDFPAGRNPISMRLLTNNELFNTILLGFNVQKGIVVLPQSVYFGKIPKAQATAWFSVSRPGKPFKITEVTCSSPFFTVVSTNAIRPDEFHVTIKFNGQAPSGNLQGVITVKTDDPKQPVISVPIQGTVE